MRDPSPRDELILAVVARIPSGALASYGDVAALVSELGIPCTARQVAAALARFGSAVCWWRVVQSAGTLAPAVAGTAAQHLRAEGMAIDGRRVPLSSRRWAPDLIAVRESVTSGGHH